jgi:hypothetical protein
MTDRSSALIQILRDYGDVLGDVDRALTHECQWLIEAEPEEVNDILETLLELSQGRTAHLDAILPSVLHMLVQRQLRAAAPISEETRQLVMLLYQGLENQQQDRWRLLQWLSSSASPEDLAMFVDLLIAGPPADWHTAAAAFAPLFQRRQYDSNFLFPDILEAIQHVAVAAPILDLANYLKRRSVVDEHPAACRVQQLTDLLETVVAGLSRLETDFDEHDATVEKPQQQVEDSVALVISLCDTLALIGDPVSIGKLRRALQLKHRRIRTEAAAALARFGEQEGMDTLVEMASEPVVRLRVLADAEEFGILDRIDAKFTTNEARAEACVALELAQATYFGVPPQQTELIDFRELYWPGYDEPQACYLFRYSYRWKDTKYSNIALAGPVVHTFVADLNDVPIDDIYAAYAGWHVEHDEIYEVDQSEWNSQQRSEAARRVQALEETGYTQIRPRTFCYFFGDDLLIATAVYEGTAGTVIVDPLSTEWQPIRNPDHPLGPAEALYIFTGRRLLKTFN